VTDAVEAMEAGDFLTATAALLAPWQEKERESGRGEASEAEVSTAVNETAAFVANRPEEARDWLAENEPPPVEEEEPEEPPVHEDPISKPLTEPIIAQAPPAPPPENPLRLGRVARRDTALCVHLGFAEAGEVRVRATTRLGGRPVTACSANASIAGRGREAISCQLTPRALERLTEGPLRLRLRAVFTSTAGSSKTLERQIRLGAI
jgi:hypothetical protein